MPTKKTGTNKPLLRKDGRPTKELQRRFTSTSAQQPRFGGHVPLESGSRPKQGDPGFCKAEISDATNTNRVAVTDTQHLLGELEGTAKDLYDIIVDVSLRFKRTQRISRYARSKIQRTCKTINMIHERLGAITTADGPVDIEGYRDDIDLSESSGSSNPVDPDYGKETAPPKRKRKKS